MEIKKIIASAFMAMIGVCAMAQTDLETFQFVDKNGNVIPDGTTLTINETEVKDGILQISTGLYVKNNTNTIQAIALDYDIQTIPSGNYSICYPGVCQNYTSVGLITKGPALVDPSDPNYTNPSDLQAEWFPSAYGESTMTIQIKVHDVTTEEIFGLTIPSAGEFKAYGPKITLNLVYADPTGINGVYDKTAARAVSHYNAAGLRLNSAVKGLNIEKLSDGKTIKYIVK